MLQRFSSCVVLVGLVTLSGVVPAQRGFRQTTLQSSKVTVADELGREPLEVARRAVEGGDPEHAVTVYQEILDKLADKVAPVFLAPRLGTETDHILPLDRFAGLRDHVQSLLRALPADALAKYHELSDRRAAEALDRALVARDPLALRQIVTRYFLTPSGPIALNALADIFFEDGRVDEALDHVDRLLATVVATPETMPVRARAALRKGLCICANGNRAALEAFRKSLDEGLASAQLTFADKSQALGAAIDGLIASTAWPPAPTPIEKSLTSFTSHAWEPRNFAVQEDDDDMGFGYRMQPAYARHNLGYYPVIPAVSDTAIYMCDGLRIEGISLTTRQQLWPAIEGQLSQFQGLRNWNAQHEVVFDRGLIFASLEDEPEMKGEARNLTLGFRPRETIAVRKLYAVDAQTGEVKWTHARFTNAKNEDERAFIDRISVNTPPLVQGDRVYVAATYYQGGFRNWLCCFDRDTGGVIWRTYIAQGQAELNMFGNPIKEIVPGHVGAANGLVVYATNLGVAAAVDATTGTPRWVTAYDQVPVPSSDGTRSVERTPTWAGSRPQFFGKRVYIAPSDAYHVFAFDVESGEPSIVPGASCTSANAFRHMVGVFDGTLIVAGREVHAFDLTTPAPTLKWNTAATDGAGGGYGDILGRPGVAGEEIFYFRPSSGGNRGGRSELRQYNIRSGRLIGRKVFEGPDIVTGNIVFSQDATVVAGERRLGAYFDINEMATKLKAGIAAHPDDAGLQLRLGQLLLQSREVNGAVAAFERARTLATSRGPQAEVIRSAATQALFNILLDVARDPTQGSNLPGTTPERFAKAFEFATGSRQQVLTLYRQMIWGMETGKLDLFRDTANRILADFPDEIITIDTEISRSLPQFAPGSVQRAGLLASVLGAVVLDEAHRGADAVAFYQQALHRYADETIGQTFGNATTIWRFAFDHIQALVASAGPKAYEAQERAAKDLLADGKTGNLDALRAVLDRYPNSGAVDEAYLELSRRLRESKRDREALAAVQKQLSRFGAASIALLIELSRSLESAQCLESARDILRAMRDVRGSDPVTIDGQVTTAGAYAQAQLARPEFAAFDRPMPIPEVPLGLPQRWVEQPSAPGDAVDLIVPQGRRPTAADSIVLVHRDAELRGLDLDSASIRWRRPVRDTDALSTLWHDGRLICVLDGELACLDPVRGTELWRSPLGRARVIGMHAAHGKVYMLVRDASIARGILVRSFDIVSGDKVRDVQLPTSGSPGMADPLGATSFESSAAWLLVRLDQSAGACAVLDGITGDIVTTQPANSAPALPPLLSANNLLVTSARLPAQGTSADFVLQGRDPRTKSVVWTAKLEKLTKCDAVYADGRTVVLSTRTGGDRDRSIVKRDLVAFDITAGTSRLNLSLRATDIPYQALVAGDILYAIIGLPDGKRFVRAYDTAKNEHLWDSVTYSGQYLSVHVVPTKEFAVVRTGSRDTATDRRTDTVQFFDVRTGLLKDAFKIENTHFPAGEIDMEARDHALVIHGGAQVLVRR